MTLLSRVLGLVRDVVIAHLIGAGAAADVFLFANRIPNFLRRLFAEGAFSQAFVPVLAEYQKSGDINKTREFIGKVSGTLGGLVSIVTILAMVGSPVVAALFGMGWFTDWMNDGPDAHKFEQASLLLKITFPYLWFITFVALSGAVLNTIGKFGVMSFSPVLLNIAMIATALFLAPQMDNPDLALAIGIFLGGLLQFLFQIPFMKQAGLLVKPKWAWRDEGVTKIRKLMIPALFGVSVSQINLLLDTVIASFLMTGSISWLYYSDRLLEFPLGLFGIAISTVILPTLARHHVNREGDSAKSAVDFRNTMDWGVRMILLLGVPAAIGIAVLAQPMLLTLFMRGNFILNDVHAASYSLWAFNAGLLSFMLIKILANGYYARQDTKTPVKIGIIAMVSNMGFNLLAIPFSYVGLAIASAMSATLNAYLLYRGLAKADVYHFSRKSAVFFGKVLLAAIAMGAAVWYYVPEISQWAKMDFFMRVYWLIWLIVLAAIVYGATLILLLGVPAAIGIAVLAQPMLLTLFMRGNFMLNDVHASSYSLWAFNAGLLSFMLIKILANGYYARQDTKTPVKIGIIAMVSNMGFNLLAIPFSYVGLAIASAMSATLNAYLLYRGLAKSDVYHFSRKSAVFFGKVLLAAIAMGAAVWYYVPEINQWAKMDFFMRVYWLVWLIVLAAIVYGATLILLGIRKHHLLTKN